MFNKQDVTVYLTYIIYMWLVSNFIERLSNMVKYK